MKILSFAGTRPEIIKNLAFLRAQPRFPGLEFEVLHTGQNHGDAMVFDTCRQLGIPLADSRAPLDRTSFGTSLRDLLDYTATAIRTRGADAVISLGDTDTAFAVALMGARMGVKVAHVEGGIRCDERHNPEEINRRLSDHVADWIFTISDEDSDFLRSEGISRDRVFNHGDITCDALKITLAEQRIPVRTGEYDLVTIHRQENANHPERLLSILKAINDAGFPAVFPMHPRTEDRLRAEGYGDSLKSLTNIEISAPLPFVDFIGKMAGCRKVISDSGGARREAYLLGKPVISLVDFVWFKKMNELGYEYSAGSDLKKLTWAIGNFSPPSLRPPLFGDGEAGGRILKTIWEKCHD